MDPILAGLHYIKLAELWKLPDLARKVEEVINTPKTPDPRQEEILNNELEASRLKLRMMQKEMEEIDSKIHERVSRALENDVDIRAKNAKALVDEEKARKLRSEADMLDKEYLEDISGDKQRKILEQEEFKINAKQAQKEHEALVDIDKRRLEDMYGLNQKQGVNNGL